MLETMNDMFCFVGSKNGIIGSREAGITKVSVCSTPVCIVHTIRSMNVCMIQVPYCVLVALPVLYIYSTHNRVSFYSVNIYVQYISIHMYIPCDRGLHAWVVYSPPPPIGDAMRSLVFLVIGNK